MDVFSSGGASIGEVGGLGSAGISHGCSTINRGGSKLNRGGSKVNRGGSSARRGGSHNNRVRAGRGSRGGKMNYPAKVATPGSYLASVSYCVRVI